MEASSHDVLLVGGGGAGLRAAIAAPDVHPKLSVAVVSKRYPMRSHTVSAEGGDVRVVKPHDSLDENAYDTISDGDWLCDHAAVAAFVQEALHESGGGRQTPVAWLDKGEPGTERELP